MKTLVKWLKLKREALKNTRDWTLIDAAVRQAKIEQITEILNFIDKL